LLSSKIFPGNSGESYHKRKHLLLVVNVLILTLLFTYGIIAQQVYLSENNYDFTAPELIKDLIDEEVSTSENNKFQITITQMSTLILISSIHTGIYSYQLKTTYHVRHMKVILRL